ncbi:MAG: hypothetical protein JWO62_2824 [Acidimicrobiaceae bacterium]|jgi:glutamine phosphoribosylpyrophosphate amidotransferase|nr:hypothetical protein [Acidimicrobiaceae bacterium]
MDPMSRRAFITRTSAVVAAAGVAAVVPGQLASAAARPATAGDRETDAAFASEGTALDRPVTAHVRDLKTGEISIYAGLGEVTIHDRVLASRLARASGGV